MNPDPSILPQGPAKHPVWHNPAAILQIAGSCFIVIAIFVLIFASWGSFSSPGRIATSIIPVALLYALGFANRFKEGREDLAKYTILTGSVIFPFAIGVVLRELNFDGISGSLFYFYIFLVSTVWYVILEFALRQKTHALLTVVSGTGLGLYFCSAVDASSYVYSLVAIMLAIFFLSVAWENDKLGDSWQTQAYTYAGVILGWLGLMSLPYLYLHAFFESQTTLLSLVIAGIFLAIAILYSQEWQRRKSAHALAVRQVAEISSAICLVVPAILAALTYGYDSANSVLALILGISSLVLSSFIRVYLFRILGYIAAGVGFFELIFLAFNQLKAEWPITLLVLGFILIGAAYSFQHFKYRELFQRFVSQPDTSLFDLGLQPEPVQYSKYAGGNAPTGIAHEGGWVDKRPQGPGCLKVFLIVVGLLIAVPLVVRLFLGFLYYPGF